MPAPRKKPELRKVPKGSYDLKWNKKKNSCQFKHRDGRGGAVLCGYMDATEVFSDSNNLYVLSLNYPRRYACIEIYGKSADGAVEAIIYEQKDVDKVFGDKFSSYSPKKIAETLLSS